MIIQSKAGRLLKTILPVIIFAIILALFAFAVSRIAGRSESEGRHLTEESIKRAAVQCYALEGIYPSDFAYLKEHYGLRPDEDKYVVYYTYHGANLMPEITVISAGIETPTVDEIPPDAAFGPAEGLEVPAEGSDLVEIP
jgi:hypothetical protein